MAKQKKPVIQHKFDIDIENHVANIVIDNEYAISKNARKMENIEWESILDMLECKRTEKDYEWMSDIFLPELPSIILTDASSWASQYFQTRNFVEVKLEGTGPNDKDKCEAAKRCINQVLNNPRIYHYQKYIRGRTINATFGMVYALCWWEQDIKTEKVGTKQWQDETGFDEVLQEPIYEMREESVYKDNILIDQFNYEILDPRNVFTDNTYCYSLQDKKWIDIRNETTYDELRTNQTKRGYFNLDLVKDLLKGKSGDTDTKKETYGKGEPETETDKTPVKNLDRIMRFGKFWVLVKTRNEDKYPVDIIPGYDSAGDILENAELIECIIEFVILGNQRVMVRFQPLPFHDSRGLPYRPVIRGLCYIHPTKDTGLSDGKYLRELQKAINDNFNLGLDRVRLATIPTLKGRKYSLEDNTTIYFEPEHVMEVENPDDIEEFRIQDNIDGMLGVNAMLTNKGQQVTATYPTTMGDLPGKASTTATAIAGAETRTNTRTNYKSLTFEFTFLLDFYWMILQMVYQFAQPETAIKMMGDKARIFDPDAEYAYSPVSSNIELEYNKNNKLRTIDQFLGRLVNLPNPNTPKLINYLMKKAFELFGDEFPDYQQYLLDESPQAAAMIGGGQQGAGVGPVPASNQYGMPQSNVEMMGRETTQ